jgi:Holliday junction DNA helicase RuvA
MLNSLKGTILSVADKQIILENPWGSIALQVAEDKSFIPGTVMTVYTQMVWNQEQGPSLFGFVDATERTVFLLIISCAGLGPKIALAILAQMRVQGFLDAIMRNDEQALSRVNGIGQKKAAQIIVQLKHKVEKLIKSGFELATVDHNLAHWNTLNDALVSLNYTRSEIARALKYVGDTQQGGSVAFDVLMRQALSFLSKKT